MIPDFERPKFGFVEIRCWLAVVAFENNEGAIVNAQLSEPSEQLGYLGQRAIGLIGDPRLVLSRSVPGFVVTPKTTFAIKIYWKMHMGKVHEMRYV
jgi:hypothetical protein